MLIERGERVTTDNKISKSQLTTYGSNTRLDHDDGIYTTTLNHSESDGIYTSTLDPSDGIYTTTLDQSDGIYTSTLDNSESVTETESLVTTDVELTTSYIIKSNDITMDGFNESVNLSTPSSTYEG